MGAIKRKDDYEILKNEWTTTKTKPIETEMRGAGEHILRKNIYRVRYRGIVVVVVSLLLGLCVVNSLWIRFY